MTVFFDHLLTMAKTSPIIAFAELWVIGCLARCCLLALSRTYRAVNIWLHGWPPVHLDADGDWKPEKEAD